MVKIGIHLAEPGMVLAKNIYTTDGKILLAAGMALQTNYIKKLKELGIPAIYVKDELIGELEIPEVISEQTRVRATKTVKKIFSDISLANRFKADEVKQTVNKVVDELLINRDVLVNLTDVSAYDDYVFRHSVNVCVLAIMTGISLGYNESQLRDLGIGALMHDIGKTKIDIEILNKPTTLTNTEFETVKKHAEYGFEILRSNKELNILSAHVALQHHEKIDGSGYPRGIKGKEIHEYARITAVADVYDALVTDRVYRPGFLPYEAVDILMASAVNHLDPEITKAFLENIAIYPIGCLVQLSTGEIGVVVDVNKGLQTRPVVRLLFDKKKNRVKQNYEIDLTKYPTVFIIKSFKYGEEQASLMKTAE